MSRPAIWAVIAGFVAAALLALGQWILGLVVVAIGGAGYVIARAIEDALAKIEQEQLGNR